MHKPNPEIAASGMSARAWMGIALVLTFATLMVWKTHSLIADQQQARFDNEVKRIESAIGERMTAYVQVLHGGRGLFVASDDVTREDWRRYVQTLELDRRYPGFNGMTFAPAVRTADLAAFIARVRLEPIPPGMADPATLRAFHLRAPPPPIVPVVPDVHAPVLFIEPLTPEKERAIGIDMRQDAGRAAVMDAAAASGDAVLSPRLRLLLTQQTQVGFIMYLAIRNGDRLQGWVTATFVMERFMRDLIGEDRNLLSFALYNGDGADPAQLLYSTAGFGADASPRPLPADSSARFRRVTSIQMPGRQWTLQARVGPDFISLADRLVPWLVALGGLLASLLLYVAARGNARWRLQATILERAQKAVESAAQAKSDFLANMSHEIRTPLNAILGSAELLGDTPLNDDQRQSLGTISQSGDHLLGVINDILDFTKVESGMLELDEQVFDLRRTVEESLELVAFKAAQKRLDLTCDFAPGTPEVVRSDGGRVRQILVNYLANAIKFTDQGDVCVEVSSADLGDGRHRLRIAVRDTGIGIPADRLDRLFKTFSQVDASTTRRYGGTGLGLVICKHLAELMGGEVAVESHPGRGSIFSFTFLADADPDWRAPPRPDTSTLAGKRLLIVDDNDTNRRVLRRTALEWGMRVADTGSSDEAIAMLRGDEKFDIAVLDYLMPEMDGIELAANIRQKRRHEELRLMLLSSVRLGQKTLADFDLVRLKPLRRSGLLDAFVSLIEGTESQPAFDSQTTGHAAVPAQPLRILLVEDNLFNQEVGLRMLASLGYAADLADNGRGAVEAVKVNAYDLVLMDVQMPVMDGLEATRQIRQLMLPAQPQIFAMSASVLDSERQACIDAGMDRHLAKPFRRQALETILREVGASLAASSSHDREPCEPDEQTLLRLVSDLGEEGAMGVIGALIDAAPTSLKNLRDAACCGDTAGIRRECASLHSNCLIAGAPRLAGDFARLSETAAQEDAATLEARGNAAAERYRSFVSKLDRWRVGRTAQAE